MRTGCGTGDAEAQKVLVLPDPAPLKQVTGMALPPVLHVQAGLASPQKELGRSQGRE